MIATVVVILGTVASEIGLVYSGGIIEDKEYKGVLKPGVNAERIGWGSKAYLYRTDQRTYIAGNTEQGADTPVPDVVRKMTCTSPSPISFTSSSIWNQRLSASSTKWRPSRLLPPAPGPRAGEQPHHHAATWRKGQG